ncbi:electron transfer flavoprotein subunit alpha [Kocuria flava]|uniref:Electron transfer flavoprotein subunit alpha n=1 Tax=Kocuria flava TaxID=446860 RepID=A0A0U3G2E6_9MICC|nr:electron transfer flavoprotein subunit alpha/FixB family protein [Kocuria flava]ALU39130.1 electron transfer flavoprotein subunit alpha [Kocuria flava]GEO90888.1 electron transfer flavoprotein subunit alpha [Kocuria flava]
MTTTLVVLGGTQRLRRADRELLVLAGGLGGTHAVVPGAPGQELLDALAAHGTAAVHVPAGEPDDRLTTPLTALTEAAARACAADAVLLSATPEATDVAARLGVRLEAGVVTDVVALDAQLTATKQVLAGGWTTRCRARGGVLVATVRPHAVELPDPAPPAGEPAGRPALRRHELTDGAPAARIVGRDPLPPTGRPSPAEARVVVAGGRGTGGDFGPLEELADVLGAAIGASRAAVDAGWIGPEAQIGQTGLTVSPQLYVSCGISGALQQRAGMQTAKVVVAVNKDPQAPVFEIADLGVVGDLRTVLPQAAAHLRRLRS